MVKKALINYIKRLKDDEIYTPEYAVRPLLPYLPKDKIIWECTDFGNSNITKCLKDNGHKVIGTREEEIDFLRDRPPFRFDIIVTNPPYSLKTEFLKRCYEYGVPFALLLPITALEGIERGKLFRKFGIEVLVLDRRIEFMENKKAIWFNSSWFCWKLLPEKLIFAHLDKEEKKNGKGGANA